MDHAKEQRARSRSLSEQTAKVHVPCSDLDVHYVVHDLDVHYLSPAVAATLVASSGRQARAAGRMEDSNLSKHFTERERIKRFEAEEVCGRRAQLQELRQKLERHLVQRSDRQRQLVEQVERSAELIGLRCDSRLQREEAEAVRRELASVMAAVVAHCQQDDAADEAHRRERDHATLSVVRREGRVLQLQQQTVSCNP